VWELKVLNINSKKLCLQFQNWWYNCRHLRPHILFSYNAIVFSSEKFGTKTRLTPEKRYIPKERTYQWSMKKNKAQAEASSVFR
jgi:hypothetical protein